MLARGALGLLLAVLGTLPAAGAPELRRGGLDVERGEGPASGSLLRSHDPAGETFEVPLRARVVRAAPGLASPFALTALALEEPRDGTSVPLGALLRARGRIAAVGTGSVLAVWRVDGLDLEVVPLTLVAGREVVIESRLPLPTDSPRFHEVELRTLPAEGRDGLPGREALATDPARYRVLPPAPPPPDLGWMAPPGAGVYLASGGLPTWVWLPLPGVAGYALFVDCVEVGRAASPEWTLPAGVREGLPAGEHTFEVRRLTGAGDRPAAETTPPDFEAGFTLLAAPARLDLRESAGRLTWAGLPRAGVFALEVREAPGGRLVLRRITARREASLAELALPVPGHGTVSVQAFNDRGEKVAEGGPLELLFAPPSSPPPGAVRPGGVPLFTPRPPEGGGEIHEERPALVFAFRPPGTFDRSRVRLLLDGDDLTEQARWKPGEVRVVPLLPLPDGEHLAEVRLSGPGGREETLGRWAFRAVPPRRRSFLAVELRDAPALIRASDGGSTLAVAPHLAAAGSGAAGKASVGATWAPSAPLDGEASDLPEPDGVLQLERGGLQLRAGTIRRAGWRDPRPSPSIPSPPEEAELSAIRSSRRALDARWEDETWGRVALFADLLDPAVTGAGAVPRRRITALDWRLPSLFGRRLDLQLTSLRARAGSGEGGAPGPAGTLPAEAGELGAVLLAFRPGGPASGWSLVTEAAFSRREESPALSTPERGSAFRLRAEGALAGQALTLRFSRVDEGFSNPGDPGLVRGREEGGLELSRSATRWDYRLSATLSRDRGARAAGAESREGGLQFGWRPFPGTEVRFEGTRQEVASPQLDFGHTSFRLSLSRRSGLWTADLAASGVSTSLGAAAQSDRFLEATVRRDEAGAWGLTAGLSGAEQRLGEGGAPVRIASFLLAPVWKPGGDRLRLSLRLQAAVPGFGDAAFDDGTLGALTSATWTFPERWRSLCLTAQAGWRRSPLGTERRAELGLSLSPFWRTRK